VRWARRNTGADDTRTVKDIAFVIGEAPVTWSSGEYELVAQDGSDYLLRVT